MDDLHTAESPARIVARFGAFVGGIAVLYWAMKATFGLVFFAPVGIWAVSRIHRSRGRRVDGFGSFASAVGSVMIVLSLIGVVVASIAPTGSMDAARRRADSTAAVAAKQPPPAWLDRLSPGLAERAAAQRSSSGAPINASTMVIGAVVLIGFVGSFVGTIGWIGAALLVFSVKGRWLHERSPVPDGAETSVPL